MWAAWQAWAVGPRSPGLAGPWEPPSSSKGLLCAAIYKHAVTKPAQAASVRSHHHLHFRGQDSRTGRATSLAPDSP